VNVLRQHREEDGVVALARVFGEPGKLRVCIFAGNPESRPPIEGLLYYRSREIACAAADVLTRHHLGNHQCAASECSGWI
jgi:hypothetical protein